MLFDTHAHYDDERFDADRDALLASMPEKNVGLIVNPGCDLPTSRMAVALAEKFDFVYAAVGIHPENCGDFVPEQIDALRNLAKNPRVVAIGEIGLDYYWAENPPRALQQEVLRRRRSCSCPLSSTTGTPTGTLWPSCGNFPGSRGYSTASPDLRKWHGN
mgnify:CR=1 FL=1